MSSPGPGATLDVPAIHAPAAVRREVTAGIPEDRTGVPQARSAPVRLAVVWIDWYAYHVARFRGLLRTPELAGRTRGIELVGGVGVHAGLKFREPLPPELPVDTLLPEESWGSAGQLRLARLLWHHLSALDPEAVLVPGYYTLPALAAALWARAHGRVSILMTESTAYDHRRVAWKEWGKSALLRALFDFAMSGGLAHRTYLDQLGFPLDRVAKFYDVVDNEWIAREVAALRASARPADLGVPASPYFLYVGRLAPEKNVDGLLRAWLAYRAGGGSWGLVLVGDGPATAALRAQAAASGFGAEIHFAGLRASDELPPFYAFAGCFVLPSTREPWGLVVNEAMAAGLPVLVSRRCGSAEDLVRDGENGFTFDPHSTEELARHLTELDRMPAERRTQMGAASAACIQAYSPESFGQEIAMVMG